MGPIHKRLIGVWKSDKSRTLDTWKAYAAFPRARKRRVAAIFGKLELRYTQRCCYVTIGEDTTRNRYDVVGEDDESIVIRTYSDAFRKKCDPIVLEGLEDLFSPTLQHLHVETERGQEYYWIGTRGLIEWFKKKHPNGRRSE